MAISNSIQNYDCAGSIRAHGMVALELQGIPSP